MPTYEYRCQNCGHQFEKAQKMGDSPVQECPQCGGTVQRLISGGSGFMLKGSGTPVAVNQRQDTCCARGVTCDAPKRCCTEK